jgi:acetylornithine deacetylase
MTDVSDLTDLLQELVAIESINPDVAPDGSGEEAVARFVAGWLERAGLTVEIEEVTPGRPNVIGTARGRGGGRTLLLNAHTDTVGVAAMHEPHVPRIAGGRLHGRGAYDMKSGLAAAMVAAASVRGLDGDVVVAAVCDEEAGGAGTKALVQSRRHFDGAIVTEPTELGVAIAHKGFVGFEITTAGRAAHGSMPELGVDAILHMGPILVELDALDGRLRAEPGHPLLGTASLHASLIEGGQEFSSYPEHCALTGEWRTLPGSDAVDEQLRQAIARSGVDARLRLLFRGEPFEIAADAELVQLVCRHAQSDPVGMPYWADSAQLAAAGVPTVLFGPSGTGAHAAEEWVDLASAQRVCDVLIAVASEFCG